MSTHLTVVLDASGSMDAIAADTRGGLNAMLAEHREGPDDATVSLYEFDTTVERVYHARPVGEAPALDAETYRPGGRTALHDALLRAVDETRGHVDGQEGAGPENVAVVTLTDGRENASETPAATVRERVRRCRETRDWEFLFIGANQDAALAAEEMGMDAEKSLDMAHTGEGTRAAYESTADRVQELRETGQAEAYAPADRRRQREAADDG